MKKELVFLHGWGRDKKDWNRVITCFGQEYNITALDLPGFGEETNLESFWGIPEYTDWVIEKVKDKSNVILVGHSFGGRIAGYIASKNIPNIVGLVLYAAPCLYRPSFKIKSQNFIIPKLKSILNLDTTFFKKLFKSEEYSQAETTGKKEIFKRVVSFDQTDELKKIAVPTLILWGKNDKETSYNIGQEMSNLIQNSSFKLIENADHNIHLTNPTLIYGIINNYVKSI